MFGGLGLGLDLGLVSFGSCSVVVCHVTCDTVNPLAGRMTFLSLTVHGRSDNIVVLP